MLHACLPGNHPSPAKYHRQSIKIRCTTTTDNPVIASGSVFDPRLKYVKFSKGQSQRKIRQNIFSFLDVVQPFFARNLFEHAALVIFYLRFRLGRARALPASAPFRPCPSPKTNLNNASRHDANPRSPPPPTSDTRAAILYTSRCCHRRAESSKRRKETLFSTKPLLRSSRKPVSFKKWAQGWVFGAEYSYVYCAVVATLDPPHGSSG